MNEDTWIAVLQALPTSINIPLVIFDNPIQAYAWIQLNGFQNDDLWIVTNDALAFWVVSHEAGEQLIHMGFDHIRVIPPPIPPPTLRAHGDETAWTDTHLPDRLL